MFSRKAWRRLAVIAVGLLTLLAAGCGAGSTDNSTSGSVDAAAYTQIPKSGCGSVPARPTKDPEDVLADFPATTQAAYGGMASATLPSRWANWKPNHGPPYTVGYSTVPPVNDYQAKLQSTIKKQLAASPTIEKVVTNTTATTIDVAGQIRDYNSFVNAKVDLIVMLVLQPPAVSDLIERTADKGIPTVTVLGVVEGDAPLNVNFNSYKSGASTMATAARLTGGKGNTMFVHGIPGTDPDTDGLAAYKDVLKRCPGLKDQGGVYGVYLNSAAKSETLKFLATHPQPIDAVMQAGTMGPGIIQAFEQAGRRVPTVVDIGNQKGSLGYWRQNAGKYPGTGTGIGAPALAEATASVILRTLEGQGPRINNMLADADLITPANLDQWAQANWNLRTPGTADGPTGAFMTESYIDQFFNNPATPK